MEELSLYTLRHVLERSAVLYADQPSLSQLGCEPLTFRDLHDHAEHLALWLRDNGVGTGDRVALLAENSPNWGIAYFAITGMGAIAVPILPEFHADAVQHILRHSEAKAVFVSERLFPKLEEGEGIADSLMCISMETFQSIAQGTNSSQKVCVNSASCATRRSDSPTWPTQPLRRTTSQPSSTRQARRAIPRGSY